MLSSKVSAAFERDIAAGMEDADRATAEKLELAGPVARVVWATLMSVNRATMVVPLGALLERLANRWPSEAEEVRAALTVLLTLKLVALVDDLGVPFGPPDWYSPAGYWGPTTSETLLGSIGSPRYPLWGLSEKWVLVTTNMELAPARGKL